LKVRCRHHVWPCPRASPQFSRDRNTIIELAARRRIPAIYEWGAYAIQGGLMGYGPNLAEMDRQAAKLVDKILKGAKPADLPVEQPTKFELIFNMKTAKALGLTIPPSLLLRADQVIQ
jgi:putative ABC transport system substrate-binding protein